jgi:menaquinone-dependent protoporphyrinogen oxidase
MKTLIVFASKYGGTRISAEKIAKEMNFPEMNKAQICELDKDTVPDLNQFDCIIVGGPLFAGTLHKSVKSFLIDNVDVLLRKKVGLFLAGLRIDEAEEPFSANFPESILKHATVKEMIGGICDPKTLNVFFKMLMKAITKTSDYSSTISDEKIKKLADSLKADTKS